MSKKCTCYYKTCRESAGTKLEDGAAYLNVAGSSLSDYENNKARVP